MNVRIWIRVSVLVALAGAALFATRSEPAKAQTSRAAVFRPTQDEYTVKRGDTLWDITDRVAGSAVMWPRVWGLNPEIANPNWIYPGDVIYFYRRDFQFPALNDRPQLAGKNIELERDEVGSEAAESSRPVEVVQTRPGLRRKGGRRFYNMFITEDELEEAGKLVNAADDDILLSNRDIVFLEFPEEKLPARDDDYLVYRTVQDVRHPTRGGRFGYITEVTGFARIRKPREDGIVTAELFDAELEIERGNLVAPITRDLREPVLAKPSQAKLEGVVVAVHSGWGVVGSEQQLAFVDLGAENGLEQGNELVVYRRSDEARDRGRGNDLPLRPIALVRAVDIKDVASTVVVLDTREEIEPGQKVRTALVEGQ